MKYYFTLQYKMLNRHISEFGLPPILGYILSIIAFIGLSFYLFIKTQYAPYIYAFLAISSLSTLSEPKRNNFLKSCFSKKQYFEIRMIENAFLTIPFFLFLLFQAQWLVAFILLISSLILVFVNLENKLNYSIPTPFHKQPFEFIIGFRKTYFICFFAYFLTIMAISVGNFNLGIFSLLLVLFTSLSFYADPENPYFVWIFSLNSKRFLFQKIKTALLHTTILCLPIIIGLSIFFSGNIYIIFAIQCVIYFYLLAFILAKYSTFPKNMNLPQIFLFGFGVLFPPLLFGIIPYFYSKSIQRLNKILK